MKGNRIVRREEKRGRKGKRDPGQREKEQECKGRGVPGERGRGRWI